MAKLFSSSGFGATMMVGSLVAIVIVTTMNHLVRQGTAVASVAAGFGQPYRDHYKYSIAIDAGSTHSRVILYRWLSDKLNDTGLVQEVKSCNVKTGISSAFSRDQDFQANEAELRRMADGLLNCVRNVTQYVPDRMLHHAKDDSEADDLLVYLGATAGMRLLNLTHPDAVSKIFQRIKQEFDAAGFKSRRVSILTGQEEGLFAWIAANYLSGTLFSSGSSPINYTYGIMDMGGSSAQIAYQSPDFETKNLVQVKLFGHEYHVNTFSNLCFGTEQAFNRYLALVISRRNTSGREVEVPCFPRGFESSSIHFNLKDNACTKRLDSKSEQEEDFNEDIRLIGTGDPEKCQTLVNELVNVDQCRKTFQICMQEVDFRVKNSKLHPFYAISAYYHLTKVLNLPQMENISRQQYLSERHNICSLSQKQLLEDQYQRYRIPFKYIPSTCFKLSFIISTLTNLYKFDDVSWPRLRFTNRINNSYLGWITGLMIVETGGIPSSSTRPNNDKPFGNHPSPPLIFYSLISVLGAIFFLGLVIVLWNHFFLLCMKKPINMAATSIGGTVPPCKTPLTQAIVP